MKSARFESCSSPTGLQRDRFRGGLSDLAHALRREVELAADLLGRRLTTVLLHQAALGPGDLVEALVYEGERSQRQLTEANLGLTHEYEREAA